MTRRLRRRLSHLGKNKEIVDSNSEISDGGCLHLNTIRDIDWTTLPDDTIVQLFSYLNYRDRASLSSTCQTFRLLGSSPCLWDSLDLRSHKFDIEAAESLSSRSRNLQKLRFRGADSACAIINLQARGLREISGDFCPDITDAIVSVIAARHEMLESLQLGPNACERISSDAIKAIALCCPKLRRLRLSGVREVSKDAINALAMHCGNLLEVALMESENVDEMALGNLTTVQFLSLAGTRNLKWGIASQVLSKLPKLEGLDVSRTDISLSFIRRLISWSENLKVLFVLSCPVFEAEVDNDMVYIHKGKILLTVCNDIFKEVSSLFADASESNMLPYWRSLKIREQSLDKIVLWIEWVLSHSLLRVAENNQKELDIFWVKQGTNLLLHLLQSSEEDVQERAATALATFVVIDDENATIDCQRAEAVMQNGGIQLLLDLAKSCHEGLQSEAAKERAAGALANLAADDKCSMEVAMAGAVHALVMLVRHCNFEGVQEQAARALANLAAHGDSNNNNAAIGQEAGAIEALVRLTYSQHEGVRHEAAGALWNLSFDDKNREAIAAAGGIVALVSLAQSCSNSSQGLQERAAGALWGLSVSEANSVAIGQEGGVASLIALARSSDADVHETAAGALWNLAFNPGNALRIVEDGGVPALVHICTKSLSKMARFMAALALAYIFDGRMDEIAAVGPSSDGDIKSVTLNVVKRISLKHIEAFVCSFSDSKTSDTVIKLSAPTALTQVAEAACIPEAGLLRCSAAEIGRFVAMLRNHSSILKACSAFALLQFTMPGGRHATHHTNLLQNAGAPRILRAVAASASAPFEAKVFAKIVIWNLEHYHVDANSRNNG
ncbi:protein ARABIDILLO 1 isoform X2 [Manihot esculenta]|uniref:Uncharacterized protein n=2 Tax=Manihot esculenta TaxID=3983 RepID=A0ACB7GF39_MANES|nr:protein ARABIDILLO 1 isoform X2 [Manihot esculenta]KAG8638525.1 hypothetical protein MANES_14G038600v8 [Manihot esculenta]KAG8638526.1 hypothetical protein MANES_14G038600v8 [Manihot esculenta]